MQILRSEKIIVFLAALLLAIWPLPGTIAARNVLLLLGLGFSAVVCLRHARLLTSKAAWPLWLVPIFFVWLLAHCFAFPNVPDEQLYDLQGDWARAACASVIGIALGLGLGRHSQTSDADKAQATRWLLAGLSATVVIYCCRYLYEVVQTGVWLHLDFFEHPFHGKTALVVMGGLLLPALYLRISDRIRHDRWSPGDLVYPLAIAAMVIAFFFSNTKNGILVFVACTVAFVLQQLHGQRKRLLRWGKWQVLALLCMLALLVPLKAHWETNPAWRGMSENMALCIDIEHYDYWKDAGKFPIPVNKAGHPVDISTCQRVAWGWAGVQLVEENPWGYGLINHSFGALAAQKWPDFVHPVGKTRGATHSGLIDFTLGFGLPGLAMILIPLVVAFMRARSRQGFWDAYIVWAVPVIFGIYSITEVCTGHFIELLFFLIAFFVSLTIPKELPDAAA